MPDNRSRPLQKILGLGFGLALAFGNTVGVGILRLPGTLAEALGDSRLVVLFWILGGLYAFFGAVAVAELAAMMPAAGGFYVYARRAFGERGGFVIGWADWLGSSSAIAFQSVTATAFLAELWPPAAAHAKAVALTLLAAFTGLHWVGLKFSRSLTGFISATVGLLLVALVLGCLFVTPAPDTTLAAPAGSAASLPLLSAAMLGVLVTSMRAVLATYDGWYAPIYVAEENTDPARTLPRAIIGGTVLVAVLYIIINLAFLRVLPLSVLAASQLPAADAAALFLGNGGALVATVISLITMFSIMNAGLITGPRILLGMSRGGLGIARAGEVSASGTPRFALGVTGLAAGVLVATGSFEQIVALAVIIFVINYLSAYVAVFVLRRREPTLARPYRALGYPYSTAVVLLGSVLFLVAAIAEDLRSALIVAALIAVSIPAYSFTVRRNAQPFL